MPCSLFRQKAEPTEDSPRRVALPTLPPTHTARMPSNVISRQKPTESESFPEDPSYPSGPPPAYYPPDKSSVVRSLGPSANQGPSTYSRGTEYADPSASSHKSTYPPPRKEKAHPAIPATDDTSSDRSVKDDLPAPWWDVKSRSQLSEYQGKCARLRELSNNIENDTPVSDVAMLQLRAEQAELIHSIQVTVSSIAPTFQGARRDGCTWKTMQSIMDTEGIELDIRAVAGGLWERAAP